MLGGALSNDGEPLVSLMAVEAREIAISFIGCSRTQLGASGGLCCPPGTGFRTGGKDNRICQVALARRVEGGFDLVSERIYWNSSAERHREAFVAADFEVIPCGKFHDRRRYPRGLGHRRFVLEARGEATRTGRTYRQPPFAMMAAHSRMTATPISSTRMIERMRRSF